MILIRVEIVFSREVIAKWVVVIESNIRIIVLIKEIIIIIRNRKTVLSNRGKYQAIWKMLKVKLSLKFKLIKINRPIIVNKK
jgi:hypothetical protein